ALDAIIDKALAKDAANRYQDCRDLIHDLRAFAASLGYAVEGLEPLVVEPVRPEGRTVIKKAQAAAAAPAAEGPYAERSRRPLLIVLALMLVVVAGVVITLLVTKKGPSGTLAQGGGGGGPTTTQGTPSTPPDPQAKTPVPSDKTPSEKNPADKIPAGKTSPEPKKGETRDARLVHEVKPAYPPVALSARVEGEVEVLAVVGPDGRVKDVSILKSHPLFDQAAIDAVSQFVYEPALRDGSPVESSAKVSVTFSLSAESRPPPTKTEPTKTEPPPPTKTEPVKPPAPPVRKGETRPAQVVRRVEPEYPDLARQARVEGDVTVQVTVGPSGRIERAFVVKGEGLLDEAALKAVRQWTFEPALQDGTPVASTMTFVFPFRLGPSSSSSRVESNKPTAKPAPTGDPGKPNVKTPGPTTTPPAEPPGAADLLRASDALANRNFRQAADSARRVLAVNPGSTEAQSILTNALIQLAPVDIKNLVDQYVLSLRVKQAVDFYKLRADPALAARVQKDMEVVLAAYDQIQATASNLTLDLKELRYPTYRARATFGHLVSGLSRQKGVRETLFNGRYTWRLELRSEAWVILDIAFESSK
ncbi:MAG: TonB family protein, partial [Candidatus Aminicenantes bacterium]|nr:TonB family protein [Candidatus Aminicenantes bacterium]